MKKLPIGIQAFEKMIKGNFVYVDKTELISKLVDEGDYYFLSRPRRFGKSLLISTLKAIFSGQKELFKNCQIYSSSRKWKKHPIIHLDFTQIRTKNSKVLEKDLKKELTCIGKSYGKKIEETDSIQEALRELIKKLAEDEKVVILVDEYDKPIIDTLAHVETLEDNRSLLKDLFGTLKGLDDHLRFVFVTGVGKFSQVSLFSGFNNLKDITISPEYATLLGYTEEEIALSFKERLEKILKERKKHATSSSIKKIAEEMKEWYNGYRFSWDKPTVYNPHSTLNFLDTGRTQSFWFRTGTPTFLIEEVKKRPKSVTGLSCAKAVETELLDISNPQKMNLLALMWQTGYLTFHGYDPLTRLYELDFPNKEVRIAFFESLLGDFTDLPSSDVGRQAIECWEELSSCDLDSFFKRIQSLFAKIPYKLYSRAKEDFYHANFIILLESMGIKVHPLEATNIGEVDLVIETPSQIYIFELKFNKSAKKALKQIKAKNYPQKYLQEKKKIIRVGINFSFKTRNLSSWKMSVLKPLLRKIALKGK